MKHNHPWNRGYKNRKEFLNRVVKAPASVGNNIKKPLLAAPEKAKGRGEFAG